MATLALVLTVLELLAKALPTAIKVGTDLKPFAVSLYKQFKGSDLTEAERAELEAAVDAQFASFMRPLPPAQPGDPDYVKST